MPRCKGAAGRKGRSNETALHSWNCETLPPRWIRPRRNLFMQIIRSDDKVGEGVSPPPLFSLFAFPSSICISNGTGRGHILRLCPSFAPPPRPRRPLVFQCNWQIKTEKKEKREGKERKNINKKGRIGKGYSGNLYVRRRGGFSLGISSVRIYSRRKRAYARCFRCRATNETRRH